MPTLQMCSNGLIWNPIAVAIRSLDHSLFIRLIVIHSVDTFNPNQCRDFSQSKTVLSFLQSKNDDASAGGNRLIIDDSLQNDKLETE